MASARHRPTAAAQRAARAAESARRIPIRPNYHCTGGRPNPGLHRHLTCDTAHLRIILVKISQLQRGGNGERVPVVNQWLRALPVILRAKAAVSLASFDTPVAEKPRSSRIVSDASGNLFDCASPPPFSARALGVPREVCNVRDNDCDDGTGRCRNLPRPCVRGYPLAGVSPRAEACIASFKVARSENFNQFGTA